MKGHGAWIAAGGDERRSKSPSARGREKGVSEDAAVFGRGADHVLLTAEQSSGNGIRKQNGLTSRVAGPTDSQCAAGSLRSNVPKRHARHGNKRGGRLLE